MPEADKGNGQSDQYSLPVVVAASPDVESSRVRSAAVGSAFAVAVVGGVVAGTIQVAPSIDPGWLIPVFVAAALVVVLFAALYLRRSLRTLFFQDPAREITRYTYEPETGTLLKGDIPNVSLRLATLHAILDELVSHIPEEERQLALCDAGRRAGESWAGDFMKTQRRLGAVDQTDFPQLFLRWAHYDATAGMGRLHVAVGRGQQTGTVLISNSFLSSEEACFPLNYWFTGYIAATLETLLGKRAAVTLHRPEAVKQVVTLLSVSIDAERRRGLMRRAWSRLFGKRAR